jgi:hypothetical protein
MATSRTTSEPVTTLAQPGESDLERKLSKGYATAKILVIDVNISTNGQRSLFEVRSCSQDNVADTKSIYRFTRQNAP